jgi:signal transduction histidine kinase
MSELALPLHADVPATAAETEGDELGALRRRLIRLAFDVHDGPMQTLVAAGFSLRELEHAVGELGLPPERSRALLAGIDGLAGELAGAEKALRGLITALEHGTPEIDALDAIVAEEIARFRARTGTTVHATVAEGFQPDTHSQAIAVRSVLREALSNVAKHAGASRVDVTVQASSSGILVEVADDGHGFDPESVRAGSIGLTSMRQRVELLGGEFSVLSRPGGPTVVTALLRRWRKPASV